MWALGLLTVMCAGAIVLDAFKKSLLLLSKHHHLAAFKARCSLASR
jgi:hypothetical protein